MDPATKQTGAQGSVDPAFWRGRRVLVTGHTGFKGSWLTAWLVRMGAEVTGFALAPQTVPSLYDEAGIAEGVADLRGDVRDAAAVTAAMRESGAEVVLHLAAQALVRPSYVAPADTYAVNVMGTVNVLDAVRVCPGVRVVVVVTSDKCFANQEWLWPYREDDPLGGRDPYSSSKACAEIVTAAYRDSFLARAGCAVATARAGNVLGGGDWAEDRLVPDIVRSIIDDRPLVLRYPEAIRPWQHVLDPLAGYLILAQRLWSDPDAAGAWNFAPGDEEGWTVRRIVGRLAELLDRPGDWAAEPGPLPHEAGLLRLDASRARTLLGWRPRFALDETLRLIAAWYGAHASGTPAADLVDAEIARHQAMVSA
jgi:CDP-glucose 4,6-dehydratase